MRGEHPDLGGNARRDAASIRSGPRKRRPCGRGGACGPILGPYASMKMPPLSCPACPPTPPDARLRVVAAALVALLAQGCGSSSSTTHAFTRPPLISIFESGPQLRSDPAAALDTHAPSRRRRREGVRPVDRVRARTPIRRTAARRIQGGRSRPLSGGRLGAVRRDRAGCRSSRHRGRSDRQNPPPLWAAGPGAPPGAHPQWKPSPAAYGQFMRAVGTRYSGSFKPAGAATPLPRVSYWSIWNEPNFGPDLAPQAIDHSTSRCLRRSTADSLGAAWSALAATGHGHDTTLIGELAPRGQTGGSHPGNFDGMVPLRFLRALYCVDGSLHPLTRRGRDARGCPTRRRLGGASAAPTRPCSRPRASPTTPTDRDDPAQRGRRPMSPTSPTSRPCRKLERTLDRLMRVYGSSHRFPIYSTEFGYQTDPPERITARRQPKARRLLPELGGVPVVAQSADRLLRPVPADGHAGRQCRRRLRDRPAVRQRDAEGHAGRLPPADLPAGHLGSRSQELEVWGACPPLPLRARSSDRVEIQFRPAAGGAFQTVADGHAQRPRRLLRRPAVVSGQRTRAARVVLSERRHDPLARRLITRFH